MICEVSDYMVATFLISWINKGECYYVLNVWIWLGFDLSCF